MWTKNDMPLQTGKTAIVTGANAGVGYETVLAFYEKGAKVILACRNTDNAEQALDKIQQHAGTGIIETALLDLASVDSVKKFADDFISKHQQLDILINNARVMMPPASKTTAGFELQFGTNFIGHFALTGYLYPLLKSTPGSRIITVSSLAYLRGVIDFDNLRSEKDYEPMREYAQSKLADLMFSIELQRRIEAIGDKVFSIAAQPGANRTELVRHMSKDDLDTSIKRVGGWMEPWQGALPSLYAAVSNDAEPGALYGPDQDGGYRGYPAKAVIAEHALDERVAQELWKLAEEITGVHYPV